MKKLLALCVALGMFPALFAQDLKPVSVNKSANMDKNGQSAPSEEARYVLGLVRNNRADLLNAYFDASPWKIQTEVDIYTNADKNASVSVFCAAVDLGYVDVVKAFVGHGYGPADLCTVHLYSTEKVIVSKADYLFQDNSYTKKDTYSSSNSSYGSTRKTWFGSRSVSGGSGSSSSSHYKRVNDITEKYSQVSYAEKNITKTYFANPLDFATGEMFDYLWAEGFRSNNLFTRAALDDAKRQKRRAVWDYIMDNAPETLLEKPRFISEEDYRALLDAAKKGSDTLAYEAFELLGQPQNAKEAAKMRRQLLAKIEAKRAESLDSRLAERVRENLSARKGDDFAQIAANMQKNKIVKPENTLGEERLERVVANLEREEARLQEEASDRAYKQKTSTCQGVRQLWKEKKIRKITEEILQKAGFRTYEYDGMAGYDVKGIIYTDKKVYAFFKEKSSTGEETNDAYREIYPTVQGPVFYNKPAGKMEDSFTLHSWGVYCPE